ncbi:MAG TPA: type II CAAX endopeptidase family protein, partial [Reyranella sp.]|nr:type II CAAX endopeptidase family protein [Reyranella sp.]
LVVWFLPDRGMLTVLGAFFGIALLGVAVAVAPLGRAALPALGLRPAGWAYPVVGTIATLALSVAVSQFGIEPQGVKHVVKGLPGNLLVGLALLAVLAPLVEELIFRGLLYGLVAGRWGGLTAWLVSSLAFATAHYEPAHVVLVLPLGLLFGWLRWRTDSLVPSLIAHILNNAFALLAAIYAPEV